MPLNIDLEKPLAGPLENLEKGRIASKSGSQDKKQTKYEN